MRCKEDEKGVQEGEGKEELRRAKGSGANPRDLGTEVD